MGQKMSAEVSRLIIPRNESLKLPARGAPTRKEGVVGEGGGGPDTTGQEQRRREKNQHPQLAPIILLIASEATGD